jgi:ABC-type Co2+ transport system permease subunit
MVGDHGGDSLCCSNCISLALVRAVLEVVGVGGVVGADKASPLVGAHTVVMGVITVFGEVTLYLAKFAYVVLCTDIPG